MKNINKIIVVLGFLLGVSCTNQLDSDFLFKDRMSTEDVFRSKDYSDEWLAHAYFFLGEGHLADVCSKGNIPFNFADDMYFGDREDAYKDWKNGDYAENGTLGHGSARINDITNQVWSNCYKGIRQVSIFLKYIDINKEMTPVELADYKSQAHFLRAYFYWILLRLYGPIPLLPDEGIDYMEDYDKVARPRNSYEECVNYIENELLVAAKDLPLHRDVLATARPTRGAALALRAKVLLFAASPLMNGKANEIVSEIKDNSGRQLFPQSYDEEKWAKAAAAAKDVMDLGVYRFFVVSFKSSGTLSYPATITPPYNSEFSNRNWPEGWKDIDPYESYRSLFNGSLRASDNPELIFTRGVNQSGEDIAVMVIHQLPRIANGWNTHGLTQKQCDAYYMNDGADSPGKDKEIGRGNGTNRVSGYVTREDVDQGKYLPLREGVSLQYANREPRFYASVAYNGSFWPLLNESKPEDREKQVFYYRGAGNGYTNTMFWLRTGIGVMKYVHPDDTNKGGVRPKPEPAIRYAEMLLIYAEALNELSGTYNIPSWDGSTTHVVKRDIEEMKKGIRPIRIRAGVPDYSVEEYADQNAFRAKLKRERQIELMGEGHRFFDLRRWKDAAVEEGIPIYGCNALATSDQRDLFHTPVAIPSLPTVFSKKMWFWPISHDELRRNKYLTQNPGWTYPD